jgi:hypothetical protein
MFGGKKVLKKFVYIKKKNSQNLEKKIACAYAIELIIHLVVG